MEAMLSGIPLPALIRLAKPMTDEEFLRFSDENKPFKMEREANGDLLIMTPAGIRTGNKNRQIIQVLGAWADEDGRGLAFDSNTGFTMPDGAVRSPDAAWLSQQKYDSLSPEETERFGRVCPEFVIELVSQSQSSTDLHAKMLDWIANGAELAWLIDPSERTATVYRRDREPELLRAPTRLVGEGPVSGFLLPLDRIFD
jgi:Uma2 family endonuclease